MPKLTYLFQGACWCKALVSETRQSFHSLIVHNSGCTEKFPDGIHLSWKSFWDCRLWLLLMIRFSCLLACLKLRRVVEEPQLQTQICSFRRKTWEISLVFAEVQNCWMQIFFPIAYDLSNTRITLFCISCERLWGPNIFGELGIHIFISK